MRWRRCWAFLASCLARPSRRRWAPNTSSCTVGFFGNASGLQLRCPPSHRAFTPPQARIAMVNTALTALGMWALQIPGVGLLSLFVFICSFIPIAGVIISTTPIAFVALTEYGWMKLALTILMVTGVHFVEVGAPGGGGWG